MSIHFILTQDAPIDYGRSFIQCTHKDNQVRFWVESRMQFINERTGEKQDFYQCGSCKSENTFAKRDLFKADNYDFIPVFGSENGCIFRRFAYLNDGYKICYELSDMWQSQKYYLSFSDKYGELGNNEQIISATNEAKPIVARTEIFNEETGLRAVLEYPVKTMNIKKSENIYQVDTGPVLFPDLSKVYSRPVESISLAFVAFNVSDFADFVIEAPTPVYEEGKLACKVYHYSKIVSLKAINKLYALF